MNEIVIKDGMIYVRMNIEDYLKSVVKYHWIDIVRLSLERNVSVKRMIAKLVESGALLRISKENIDIIAKFIDNKMWEMRQETLITEESHVHAI